jgi:hypothetical protein
VVDLRDLSRTPPPPNPLLSRGGELFSWQRRISLCPLRVNFAEDLALLVQHKPRGEFRCALPGRNFWFF